MLPLNVLSLFDGISCGQVALARAGIPVANYYSSEIDENAIKVTQHNFPKTIQLGNVSQIKGSNLPKIDLLIGGSPCQGFSFAGKMLNFNDPRSKLFFDFVRLIKECDPKYFLLENVRMKKEWQNVISGHLGVKPIEINSSLVSAQNRIRHYWTNIPVNELPDDKGILLKDIVEKGNIPEKYKVSDSGGAITFMPVNKHSSKNGLVCLGGAMKPSHRFWVNNGKILQRNFSQGNRVYSDSGKTPTLNANNGGIGGKTGLYKIDGVIRKLTRLECERLQTIPNGYTNLISESQAIKAIGNGWTVDVISHIFKYIRNNKNEKNVTT